MSFGTGLSGVAAANQDIKVTGNNIANASTTGFKASRAEFGDAYTNSLLGYGQDKAGAGVNVANIGQKFDQGNISQTNSALDLAIDGNGFFVTEYANGSVTYTRSGIFGVDKTGHITSNQGARLQGFGVDQNGVVSGVLTDLQVDTGNQPPRGTHGVDARVNVPAGASVLQQNGTITTTDGLAIGAAQVGPLEDIATTLDTLGIPTQQGTEARIDGGALGGSIAFPWSPGIETSWTIGASVSGPNINGGTSSTSDIIQPLQSGKTYTDIQDIVDDINRSLLGSSALAGKLSAEVNTAGDGINMVAAGVYATDGTTFSLSQPTGTLLDGNYLNLPTTLTQAPIAGGDLFANGGSIDLTSDPGQAASIQGNDKAELVYVDADPGTFSTLTSSTDPAVVDSGNFGQGSLGTGDRIRFNASVPGQLSPTLVDVDINGIANTTDLENAFNAAFNTDLGANVLQAQYTNNRLVITAGSAIGEGSYDINLVQTDEAVNNDNFNLITIGLDTSQSSPAPVLDEGDDPVLANNLLEIEVDGSTTGTIQIPAGTYSSYASLVDAINGAIDVNANLFGQVEASHLNGRIVLERTEVGASGDVDVAEGDPDSVTLDALGFTSSTKTLGIDPIDRTHSFRVNLTVPAPDLEDRSGSVEISLDEEILSIEQLASAINRELASVSAEEYIGVQAEVVENELGQKQLQFVATEAGEASQVSVTNLQAPGEDLDLDQLYGLLQVDPYNADLMTVGEPEVTNGYPEQTLVLTNEEEDVRTTITLDEGASAAEIAAQLSDYPGVSASAQTDVRILSNNYVNSGDMDFYINGQIIEANDFQDIVDEINQYQQTSLNGITAELDSATGDVVITSSTGIDISLNIESPNDTDTLTVQGATGTAPAVLGGEADAETNAKVGGFVDIILNEGYTLTDPEPRVAGLFNGLTERSFEDYTINAFNPDDPETYNETSSLPIYDSIGNQHQLQMFYVKDPEDPNRPRSLNSWTVYAQIDGENIGDPDTSLPFPENTEPSMASFKLFFNADGTVDEENTGDLLISNWTPIDPETGEPTGAFSGLPEAQGGRLPIPDPNNNSNFSISFDGTTQYGGPFSRYNFQQDGYASGRLKDLEVNDDGTVYARYTNGEAQVLGQVALASFANTEGLNPIGNTEWAESFESGDATIGEPGTGLLGSIQSAALEDSTVDLSEQLVHLIIAQRNYQANAKTIETANAVTQTIINLR